MRAFGPSALFGQNAIVHFALAAFAAWSLASDWLGAHRGELTP
jgi:hypothetical protein